MQVVKRDGRQENVKFEKIAKRIRIAAKGLKNVDYANVAQKVVAGLFDGVTSTQLDVLAYETAYSMSTNHPDYDKLATRLIVSNLHKETPSTFVEAIEKLNSVTDVFGNNKSIINEDLKKFVKKHGHILDAHINYDRDYDFDFFGFKTLERSYLLKSFEKNSEDVLVQKIIERPQHLWMRVAASIHLDDIDACLNTYDMLSTKKFIHATPTLFNSGLIKNQLSSCFLISNKSDSIEGIFSTITEMAKISQSAGGIGVHIHDVRSKGSPIFGTGGTSNGIVPMLKVFNETCRYVDQGGGKRKGSAAIYLSPHHPDIMDFLDLRKNNGKDELRCRDLNLALWVSDLFFKRVEQDLDWTLMDPNKCTGLSDCFGSEFEALYEKYESEGLGERTIKAREIWAKIIESQIETGQPYILSKDACNEKSNQKNLGTIKSSNLCAEIIEYSDPEYTSACNLASVSLPSCLVNVNGKLEFDFNLLFESTKVLTENLNKVIDISWYPVEAAKRANLRDRPIAIGIQGLSDVFAMLRFAWDSPEAKGLNQNILETMYYAFLDTSATLAKKFGVYDSYEGSPASKGILQPDMWGVTPSDRWDWKKLRAKVKKNGLRNSLGIALMPTASSSNIMGNTECFEMITTNLYKRSTLAGEFVQLNKYLVQDLIDLGLWDDTMRQKIMLEKGSVQNIPEIPVEIKELYKTVWETSQKVVIDLAADRGPYVDQSQSMNLYIKDPNSAKISSALMYGWKKGLKTLVYYLRGHSKVEAKQFTVDQSLKSNEVEDFEEGIMCSLDNPEACEMCSG